MAKKLDDLTVDLEVEITEVPPPAPPVPFVVAPQQNAPPTEAQHQWLLDHPAYCRISHQILGRFTMRGTLTPDGVFVSDAKVPVTDGAGSFGVGVPLPR